MTLGVTVLCVDQFLFLLIVLPPSIPSSFISTETKPRLPERSLLAPPSHLMTVMTLDGGVSVTNTHLSSLLDIKVSTFMSPFYKILEKSDQKEHILV